MLGAILGGIASAVIPSLLGSAGGSRGKGKNGSGGSGMGGGFMSFLNSDFAGDLMLGLGSPDPNGYLRLDPRQRTAFNEALGVSDQYSLGLQNQLQNMNMQRSNAYRAGVEDQLNAVRGLERQAAMDINASYNALGNRRAGQLIGSGFGNTTVAPGIRAMVERERSSALARNANAQAGLLSSILGQRAAGLDQIAGQNYQTAYRLGTERLRPRAELASQLGQATQYNEPGLLGRIFG